jgi:hypothetical protein
MNGNQLRGRMTMFHVTKVAVIGFCFGLVCGGEAFAGAQTANGWYEGEEIHYIDLGPEEGVTERGEMISTL